MFFGKDNHKVYEEKYPWEGVVNSERYISVYTVTSSQILNHENNMFHEMWMNTQQVFIFLLLLEFVAILCFISFQYP